MKRIKIKKYIQADAILTGDWHIQENQPICRTDDFWKTMWNKIAYIYKLQQEHNCPIWHSGDLFEHWKPSPMLLSKIIENIPNQFFTIYGNHDLPQHNLDLAYKSGIHTLMCANKLNVFKGCHWQQNPGKNTIQDFGKNILVWHTMTYQGLKPWLDCAAPKSSKLLRKYTTYDLILTGHNHKAFVEKYQNSLLVNPGSIFRLQADQIEHKPRVYLWYADTNTVKPIYLPIQENVITKEHIEITKKRNDRINAFISGLNTDWKSKMSFEDNLQKFKQKNKIRKSVMKIIYSAIE